MEPKTVINALKLPMKDFVTWWYYIVPSKILEKTKLLITVITNLINPHEGFIILKEQGKGIFSKFIPIILCVLTYIIGGTIFLVGVICIIAWTILPIVNILLLVLSPIIDG